MKKRKYIIIDKCEKLLNQKQNNMIYNCTKAQILFNLNEKYINKFINDCFLLDECDKPIITSFNINKISFYSIQISFKCNTSNISCIKQYEISYALIEDCTYSFSNNNNNNNNSLFSFGQGWSNNNNNNNNNNNAWGSNNNNNTYGWGVEQPNKRARTGWSWNTNNNAVINTSNIKSDNSAWTFNNVNKDKQKKDDDDDDDKKQDDVKLEIKEEEEEELNLKWKTAIIKINKNDYNKMDDIFTKKIYLFEGSKKYRIKMRAKNTFGWGKYCDAKEFITLTKPFDQLLKLEYVKCRGYYPGASYNNNNSNMWGNTRTAFYHPSNLLMSSTQFYASETRSNFINNNHKSDWIIFKIINKSKVPFVVTKIDILPYHQGASHSQYIKEFKIEIGDKYCAKSKKLQKSVKPSVVGNNTSVFGNNTNVSSNWGLSQQLYSVHINNNTQGIIEQKLATLVLAKQLAKKRHKKNINPNSFNNTKLQLKELEKQIKTIKKELKKYKKKKNQKYSDSDEESEEESDSDKIKWIKTKPKILQTKMQTFQALQSFKIKYKLNAKKLNYIRVSFLSNHTQKQKVLQTQAQYIIKQLNVYGVPFNEQPPTKPKPKSQLKSNALNIDLKVYKERVCKIYKNTTNDPKKLENILTKIEEHKTDTKFLLALYNKICVKYDITNEYTKDKDKYKYKNKSQKQPQFMFGTTDNKAKLQNPQWTFGTNNNNQNNVNINNVNLWKIPAPNVHKNTSFSFGTNNNSNQSKQTSFSFGTNNNNTNNTSFSFGSSNTSFSFGNTSNSK